MLFISPGIIPVTIVAMELRESLPQIQESAVASLAGDNEQQFSGEGDLPRQWLSAT
ncbi:hypothetical protein NLM33_17700 [Bradyrhizobium sp. CCGUVB1N3]|uniref:hypothetical protein n=1 Tax=Bradyrhizobium sp. CCGUVB1N3 TaxID=2949629 RepID=UPI0020B3EBF5|nr:hypothetical protein [Bradyrhizobium sp. CCGUVB1N3]MCP3472151.1 hypothetical protein [Bradyrhizobium sp. CCGUVB1N3]